MSKHWYNNGIKQTFCETPPDETFVPGMLESSKQKMKNHVFTEEHRKHIGEANLRRKPITGYHWSEEAKQRQSENKK